MLRTLLLLFLVSAVTCNWITYEEVRGKPYNVTSDHRAILINGKRAMLLSGDVHYTRSTPLMWPHVMQMAKKHGLNTIQVYLFWNYHERRRGVYDFTGRGDIMHFLELAKQAGLFVSFRFGPYICAEWRNGGLPIWLYKIPGMNIRMYNQPWMTEMKRFVTDVAKMIEPYLARNGGPIILAQIENEYTGEQQYVDWCGKLTADLKLDIPWFMCNGMSANNTINTCNSCNCVLNGWVKNHRKVYPNQPLMWTEISGRFQVWGLAKGIRPPEYIAYSMAEWIANGGSFINHYMWYGGQNYGTDAGSSVTTKYSDDSNVHSDLTPNEPKFSHVKRLNEILAKYSHLLLNQEIPAPKVVSWWNKTHWEIGTEQVAFTYNDQLSFVISSSHNMVHALFCNKNLTMPPYTTLIFDNCNMIYNSSDLSDIIINPPIYLQVAGPFNWKVWTEPTGITEPIVADIKIPIQWELKPQEQLNMTGEFSQRLWYRKNITLARDGKVELLIDTRRANALMVFIDSVLVSIWNNTDHGKGNVVANMTFNTNKGNHLLEILSVSLGVDNGIIGTHFDQKGIVNNVVLNGQIITNGKWAHQNGSIGEFLEIWSEKSSHRVKWRDEWKEAIKKPMTWFQTRFDFNGANAFEPILLNITGLSRGNAYINEFAIGRYWTLNGACNPMSCTVNDPADCNKPTQLLYHIPPEYIKAKDNLLTQDRKSVV